MLAPLVGLALSAIVPVWATPAADLNVSLDTAESYDCDAACYEILQTMTEFDHEYFGTDFDWDFYATADNFSTAALGDLLKLEPVDPTTLSTKSGVSVYHIQYVSEDFDGSLVPATGFIALPYSLPDSGKFPLIAYAHGTSGAYRGCVPSNGPELYDYDSWNLLVERGYAVVATDYAGLGNNYTEHKYCAFSVNAKDVFHSVTAARHAFGSVLTAEWMGVGHSQGGAAAWKLAEDVVELSAAAGTTEAANYLGTVALAPAVKIWGLLSELVTNIFPRDDFHNYAISTYVPLITIAVPRIFPEFSGSILGDVMKKRVGLIDEAQLCIMGAAGLTLDLSVDELTTLGPNGPGATAEDLEIIQKYQNATAPVNGGKAHGPILVVQGENDTAVLPQIVVQAYEDACADGNEVHLTLYPKQDHSGVIIAAAPEWLQWVDSRFDATSRLLSGNGACSSVTKYPFDYENVQAELELDPNNLSS